MTGEWANRQKHNSERLRDVLKRGEEGFKRALRGESGASRDSSAMTLRNSNPTEVETPTGGGSEVSRSACHGWSWTSNERSCVTVTLLMH